MEQYPFETEERVIDQQISLRKLEPVWNECKCWKVDKRRRDTPRCEERVRDGKKVW